LAGFQTVIRENVIVSVGQTTPLDFSLKLASVAETVTVVGGSAVVDTTSANVNVNLSQELLQKTPGGRDILSLIEYKVPGLIIQRPDVGGASAGMQAALTSKGTPSNENTQWLNGINVANPGAPGNLGFYYDYDAFEEVQVSTGAHDLSVPTSGVFMNMVTKSGGDRYQGKLSFFWQGDETQASNVDDELGRAGLRDDANEVDFISDASFQIGGPVLRNRLRFFTAFRDWRIHVGVPDFPEPEATDMTSGLLNLAWQVNNGNRLTGFYSRQHRAKPNRGASALLTPESTQREDDRFYIAQGLWNSVLNPRSFLEVGVSYLHIFFPARQKGSQQSLLDLTTGKRTRAAASENIIYWPRLQTNVSFQYYLDRALGGRHEIRFGFQASHAPNKNMVRRIDDLNLTYRSATNAASTVQLFNSPRDSRTTVDDLAFYAQDSFSIKRLTVTGGVRWERTEGSLPEQSSPPSRWFPNATREFAAIENVPLWKTVGPRATLAYDLRGDGRTALKAAGGRYYSALSTGTPNNVNPNFDSSETYAWSDLNGDLLFQLGELGALLSRSGGSLTSFAPGFKRPYTDEFLAGVEHQLATNFKVGAVFTYREERDRMGSVDVGVPFDSYRLVSRVDPGRDGLVGTADDASISLWDQDPATRGQNRLVIANLEALNQTFRGLEITGSRRFANRWQLLASYTVSSAFANATDARTPNSLINARGPIGLDRTHTFKLTGSYLLPHDILVSGNFRTQTGATVSEVNGTFASVGENTRRASFPLTQGNVTVNVEPKGVDRLDYLNTIDVRVSKTLRIAGRELEVMVDAYNLANANTVWSVRTLTGRVNVQEGGTGQIINQPNYRLPLFILAPRILKFGAAFRF
jgi:hypothetical protein